MTSLSLFFLGEPRIEHNDKPIHLGRRKAMALLCYLALTQQQHSRDTLSTLLWPELSQGRARAALRRTLLTLNRTAIGDWLQIERDSLALRQEPGLWVDVEVFHELVEGCNSQAHPPTEPCPDCLAALSRATSLYCGEFLAGFTLRDSPNFDEWQYRQAEHIRGKVADALHRLVHLYARQSDYRKAVEYAQRWVALDNLQEAAHRHLMEMYALADQRVAALRQYEICVKTLADELNAVPEAETTSLRDRIQLGQLGRDEKIHATPGPASPASDMSRPPNLPVSTTSIIGRDSEIQDILRLLDNPDCRLLTIMGVGGIGKSRLALAAATQAQEQYPDGVYYVLLEGTSSVQLLAADIAAVLNLADRRIAGGQERAHLLRFLADKRLLLLLDNFEHLTGGAELLSEILRQGTHVELLVTSRVRLDLQEEWLYPLSGLAYPETEANINMLDSAYPAMQLFAQRARRLRLDFSLRAEWQGVAAICRLVEGMPLAIELAAGWVQTLSCAEIAAEIARDLDMLQTSMRNVSPHQQNMRTVFEHTWQRLTPDLQRVLRRLAVFSGGFERVAAEPIAGATPALLAQLVGRSLLRREPSGRFSLHALLRQFAEEKLAHDTEDAIQTRERHCSFFCKALSRLYWFLADREGKATLEDEQQTHRVLTVEKGNVRQAWLWAVEQKDAVALRQMMSVLAHHYQETGNRAEGIELFDQASAAFDPAHDPGILGALLQRKSWLMTPSLSDEAQATRMQSLTLLCNAGPDPEFFLDTALALEGIAVNMVPRGRPSCGEERMAQAVDMVRHDMVRRGDHPLRIGYLLRQYALLYVNWGRPAHGLHYANEALKLLEPRSEPLSMVARHYLGIACMLQGDYLRAKELFERVLDQLSQAQAIASSAFVLRNLGDLLVSIGQFENALRYTAETKAQFSRLGTEFYSATALIYGPGDVARLQGRFTVAERHIQSALQTKMTTHIGAQYRHAANLWRLSRLRYDQGDYQASMSALEEALPLVRATDQRFVSAQIYCQLGHTTRALGLYAAAEHYLSALRLAQAEGIERIAVDVLTGVASLMAQRNETGPAVQLLAMVQNHPASDFETRRTASRLLAEMRPEPSRQSEQTVQPTDLPTVISSLLNSKLAGFQYATGSVLS